MSAVELDLEDIAECGCGCGNYIARIDKYNMERQFIKGHCNRKRAIEFIYCACGCGKTRPKAAKHTKNAMFINHHQFKMERNPMWNGGSSIDKKGYNRILVPNHPNTDCYGYIKEHRLVMEKHLGRYLSKDEDVHHLNGNRLDNRIENLQLMTHSEHTLFHISERKIKNDK